MKKHLTTVLAVLFSVLFLVIGNRIVDNGYLTSQEGTVPIYKAKIMSIVDRIEVPYSLGGTQQTEIFIEFTAKLLHADADAEPVRAYQTYDTLYAIQPEEVVVGETVLLCDNQDNRYSAPYQFVEHVRFNQILLLGGVFFLLLLVFGRGKGLKTILALSLTCLSVFIVLIPSVFSGFNLYVMTLITALFIIFSTITIVYGISPLGITAAIGCLSGTLSCAVLTAVSTALLRLTGMTSEESVYLTLLSASSPIDLRGIIFAAIVMGAVGAMMDVSVSISSSLLELRHKAVDSFFSSLLKSGIVIGRDMMGTMSNTLVLAYIGSSLSSLLLLMAYTGSLTQLLNKEVIIVELLQIIVGSLGLLLTIPLTSLIAAFFYTKAPRQKKSRPLPFHPVLSIKKLFAFPKKSAVDPARIYDFSAVLENRREPGNTEKQNEENDEE